MLKGKSTIRLTRPELCRWTKITGFTPHDVRTEADLQRFASACKRHFWGTGRDTRFLHFLIDEELRRNLVNCPFLDVSKAASNDDRHDKRRPPAS
jgi:hypothetical protein